MLSDLKNRDIEETIGGSRVSISDDAIFLAIEKVQALCRIQVELESGEGEVSRRTRTHYAMILEEQVSELRRLLDRRLD